MQCCERLGGTIRDATYVAYASNVDYVRVVSEVYEPRPPGAPRDRVRVLNRQARTDEPLFTAGRYPERVGAAWSIDGSRCPLTPVG